MKKMIWIPILLAVVLFIGYQWYIKNNETDKIINIINQFQQEHPEISMPSDYDLKKEKEWDSGAVQYELKMKGNNYHVVIENGEVSRIFTKFPNKQIYPTEQKEMSKGEYVIAASGLLKDAILNIQNTQTIIDSNNTSNEILIDLDVSIQDSIQLYEEFKNIIPPADWEALHNETLSIWNDYIVGEQGLIEQIEKAWNNSAEERQLIADIAKEKGIVVLDYGVELLKLMSDFLLELTGLSSN